MAITRRQVEVELVRRCGKLLAAAGLDDTVTGSNGDLNGPIRTALSALGVQAANPTDVADADLAGVTAEQLDQFFDVAELRALESISGNLDQVDITLGPRREALNQLADSIEKRIERKQKQIERSYGIGGASLTAGVISHDFAEEAE